MIHTLRAKPIQEEVRHRKKRLAGQNAFAAAVVVLQESLMQTAISTQLEIPRLIANYFKYFRKLRTRIFWEIFRRIFFFVN